MERDGHHHHHGIAQDARRLTAAFAVIFVFMIVEVVGGILSGSLALIADAGHMMTDAVALAFAAGAQWISRRPADGRRHFGYRRLQVIVAFVNGLALFALIGWIAIEALRRMFEPTPILSGPMLTVALLGLAANLVAFAILRRGAERNINVRGALLHVMGDLFGSVGAIVAAVVIATTGWTPIDPILSVAVAVLIGVSAWRLVRETFHILMEGAPAGIDTGVLKRVLTEEVPGVTDVHGVRISMLTSDEPRLTMHVCVDRLEIAEKVLVDVKRMLASRFAVSDATVQVETRRCPDAANAMDAGDLRNAAPAHEPARASDAPAPAPATVGRRQSHTAAAGPTAHGRKPSSVLPA